MPDITAEFARTLRSFDAEVRLLKELSDKLRLLTAALESGRPIGELSLETVLWEERVRVHTRWMLSRVLEKDARDRNGEGKGPGPSST